MKESEVLRLLCPERLHPQVEHYLWQLFDGGTTRKNLNQTRVRRNKEGKVLEASYVLVALHLHTVVVDYMERVNKL